jgi:mono/diheme cytochrome c family protein
MARRFKPPPADFQDPEGIVKLRDDELVTIITDGRASMPAFGDVLSEEVIAALVAYIRVLSRGEETRTNVEPVDLWRRASGQTSGSSEEL